VVWWRKKCTDLDIQPDTSGVEALRRAADEKRRELEARARQLTDLLTHGIEEKRDEQ
jgi:hypothetical protein